MKANWKASKALLLTDDSKLALNVTVSGYLFLCDTLRYTGNLSRVYAAFHPITDGLDPSIFHVFLDAFCRGEHLWKREIAYEYHRTKSTVLYPLLYNLNSTARHFG